MESLFGGTFGSTMEKDPLPFPLDGDEEEDSKRLFVPLSPSEHAQLQLAADIFNEMNKARERTKGRRWSKASVAHHLLMRELVSFFARYGGYPTTPEAVAEVTRKAVADVKKALADIKKAAAKHPK